MDSAGNVYVVDSGNHRVQKFSPTGVFERMWGFGVAGGNGPEICTANCQAPTSGSSVLGGFSSPFGIAVSQDSVYVADDGNSRIQRFNLDGTNPRAWGGVGPGAGQFNGATRRRRGRRRERVRGRRVQPPGPEVQRQRRLPAGCGAGTWTAGGAGTGFEICTVAGGCKAGIGGTQDGQFIQAEDVATNGTNTLYVVEGGVAGGPIQRFDLNGNFLGRWAGGPAGSADGQFNQARGAGVTPSGAVMVADQSNRRIQRFTSVGGFIDKWGSLGTGDGQFTAPYDVVAGPGGAIYTSDTSLHRIQRFLDEPAARRPAPPPYPTPSSERRLTSPSWPAGS